MLPLGHCFMHFWEVANFTWRVYISRSLSASDHVWHWSRLAYRNPWFIQVWSHHRAATWRRQKPGYMGSHAKSLSPQRRIIQRSIWGKNIASESSKARCKWEEKNLEIGTTLGTHLGNLALSKNWDTSSNTSTVSHELKQQSAPHCSNAHFLFSRYQKPNAMVLIMSPDLGDNFESFVLDVSDCCLSCLCSQQNLAVQILSRLSDLIQSHLFHMQRLRAMESFQNSQNFGKHLLCTITQSLWLYQKKSCPDVLCRFLCRLLQMLSTSALMIHLCDRNWMPWDFCGRCIKTSSSDCVR